MTAREKLAKEHPELIDEKHCGGCKGCPDHYGYLPQPSFCRDKRYPSEANCANCWDREIPDEVIDIKTTRMSREQFERLLDELDGQSLETLKTKNARYSSDDDVLHNFNAGAEIMGVTPAQCAWGYATKHLVALRDKILKDDFSDRDDLLEKCQDIINYIRFIWCLANQGKE